MRSDPYNAQIALTRVNKANQGAKFAVLMVDLDGLKKINDRMGHDAIDSTLRAVGETLRETCRGSDVIARYGGDEFGVLAIRSTGDAALELARRIFATLIQRSSASQQASGMLSVSIGVADTASAATDRDKLVACADSALFEAKRTGRNGAVLYGAEAL